MWRVSIKKQRVAGPQRIDVRPVPIVDGPFKHVYRFDPGMLKGFECVARGCKRDHVGLDHDSAGITANMAQKVVLMACAGSFANDLASPAFVCTASLRSSKCLKNSVIETESEFANVSSVEREGDVLPDSILDNMPTEMPVCSESSASVVPLALRSFRMALPIATSRTFSRGSLGLCGFWESITLMRYVRFLCLRRRVHGHVRNLLCTANGAGRKWDTMLNFLTIRK